MVVDLHITLWVPLVCQITGVDVTQWILLCKVRESLTRSKEVCTENVTAVVKEQTAVKFFRVKIIVVNESLF